MSSADSPWTEVRLWPGFHIHRKQLENACCISGLWILGIPRSTVSYRLTSSDSAMAFYIIEDTNLGVIWGFNFFFINLKVTNTAPLLMLFLCDIQIPLPHRAKEVFALFLHSYFLDVLIIQTTFCLNIMMIILLAQVL